MFTLAQPDISHLELNRFCRSQNFIMAFHIFIYTQSSGSILSVLFFFISLWRSLHSRCVINNWHENVIWERNTRTQIYEKTLWRREKNGLQWWRSCPHHQIPVKSHSCFSISSASSLLSTQASNDSSDSPEPGPTTCMEPFLVRRLSCRTVQLPPLAFRQAEQYYCDRKPESDTVTVPPRPTTLPLRTPPLIAITSAEANRLDVFI